MRQDHAGTEGGGAVFDVDSGCLVVLQAPPDDGGIDSCVCMEAPASTAPPQRVRVKLALAAECFEKTTELTSEDWPLGVWR